MTFIRATLKRAPLDDSLILFGAGIAAVGICFMVSPWAALIFSGLVLSVFGYMIGRSG